MVRLNTMYASVIPCSFTLTPSSGSHCKIDLLGTINKSIYKPIYFINIRMCLIEKKMFAYSVCCTVYIVALTAVKPR